MMSGFQLARGDLCGDSTGLRVRMEDVDIYDYVHFSVIEKRDLEEDEAESGQMSHVAFVHRFSKLPLSRRLVAALRKNRLKVPAAPSLGI
jgi:hypothetical protein